MNKPVETHGAMMSPEDFATFGGSKVAYLRAIRSEDVPFIYPQAPQLEPGLALFALHAADGTPILITDSREAADASAESNDLEAVSVH